MGGSLAPIGGTSVENGVELLKIVESGVELLWTSVVTSIVFTIGIHHVVAFFGIFHII